MKGSGFPGLKPINKQQGLSLHQLSKWNQQLDNDRLKTFHDQQDIKKEKKIAKQSSVYLNNSIQQIQDEAKQISRQIEEEKTKHEQLNIIVKKLEQEIYSQKLEKYEDVINNKQTDEFQEQKKIQKEKQKKLQKILVKLNSSDFQISKKIDTIRSLKKERGIHSNLLDKIQREYFDVEFYYKQLLIERTLQEKNLQHLIEQFNKVYHQSNSSILKIESVNSQKKQNLVQSQITKSQQKSNSKVPQLNFSRQREVNFTQGLKTKKQIDQSRRNAEESMKIQYKRKVNHILNDFQCNKLEEFMKKDIHQISRKQEEVLSQVDNRYEDICKMKDEIKSLEIEINEKRKIRDKNKNKGKSSIPTKVTKLQSEISKQKQQILQYEEQFYSILSKLISQKDKQSQQKEELFLQRIQTKQNHAQNFSQNVELLKQAMAYFNDKILQTHFSNINPIKRSNRSNPTQKSSSQSLKNRKSSIIKPQKLTKKVQTQNSQNQNQSTRNSECLNEIFTKYQNDSEKPGKTQKFDTVTLLTEKQFMIESKRLISQASKKKSQFGKEAQTVKK